MFEDEWFQAALARHDLSDGSLDTLRLFDFSRRGSGTGDDRDPFVPMGHAEVTAGSILIDRGDRPQVEQLDFEGHTTGLIRWVEEPPVLTDSVWQAYEARFRSRRSTDVEQRLRDARADAAGILPYSEGLKGDDQGNVWIAEYSVGFPRRYRVFASDGAWLGWVEMPDRFEVLDIRYGLVLGIQRDELDVEAIVALPLVGR